MSKKAIAKAIKNVEDAAQSVIMAKHYKWDFKPEGFSAVLKNAEALAILGLGKDYGTNLRMLDEAYFNKLAAMQEFYDSLSK